MADLSVDEFMAQLEELDVTIAEKVQNAQAKGCELRCDIAIAAHVSLSSSPLPRLGLGTQPRLGMVARRSRSV